MASPFGTLAVIANPAAGGGRVASELATLEQALAERGFAYRLSVSDRAEETSRLAAAALHDGVRFVVAVGDDATVHDVVNGMFRDGSPIVEGAVLGVVAAGSGNDFVRSFGLPPGTEAGVQRLTGETTYPLDVMKLTCHGPDGDHISYAHNLAMMGLAARVEHARARMPRWLGERARSFAGFWAGYAGARRHRVTVAYDVKTWQGEAFQVIVGNAQYGAGGLRLSPRSWPGDGVIDALVFHGDKSDAYTMMPRILRHGDHVPDPSIEELRAKIRFAVEAEPAMRVIADGRELGSTPATFQVMPQQIQFKM